MHITNLQKAGGSAMLSVPSALLEQLHLKVAAPVGIAVDGDRLIIEPASRPRYTLDELLAVSDYAEPLTSEERE